MPVLQNTQSLCDTCLKKIPAQTFLKGNRVFLKKECPKHGVFYCEHVWDDPEIYKALSNLKTIPAKAALIAIVLTYKCNLDCNLCLANANHVDIQDFKFWDLNRAEDHKIVVLTGGEPTIRNDLPKIIEHLKRRGKKVIIISNGLKLADEKYAKLLKNSGLSMVRLQFDSINDEHNKYIRGANLLKIREKAVANMEKYGIAVFLCAITIKNRNFNDIGKYLDYTLKYPKIKTINFDSLWRIGRYKKEDFVPSSEIVKKISSEIKIGKSNWINTTLLMCNIDKLFSMLGNRSRYFCKCSLRCMHLRHEGLYIGADRIFNLKTINRKIEKFYEKKSYLGLTSFIFYFIFREILINFFINKNFRIFLLQIIKNIKYLFRKNLLLFNPFYFINVEILLTDKNLDFNIVRDCNFSGISPKSLSIKPACLNRIYQYK